MVKLDRVAWRYVPEEGLELRELLRTAFSSLLRMQQAWPWPGLF